VRATTAIHPVAGDASALLRRAGAPEDLVKAAEGAPVNVIWDDCGRADWLIWLGVVEKIPLRALIDAAAACVTLAIAAQRGDRKPMRRALRAVSEMRSANACGRAAAACDILGGGSDTAGYRSPPASSYASSARAAAHLGRAAEALLGAESLRVGARDAEARARGAGIGAADHIMKQGDFTPLCYDAEDELINGSVFALEASIEASSRALMGDAPTPERVAEVTSELADAVFEVLDPVREGLRRGADPRTLVDGIDVLAYVESKDPVDNPKKPILAAATAIVFPFGGGHYHANHPYVGFVLTVGTVVAVVFEQWWAVVVIVAADAYLAPHAVRLRNKGEIMRTPNQIMLGATIVAVAHVIAAVVS
jgi:hypothetical protein